MTIELRKIKPGTARQASYGIWVNTQAFPWTLKESFGEYHLSVEVGEKGEVVEVLDADLTREQAWEILARAEAVRFETVTEQDAWLRENYPDDDETDEDRARLTAWQKSFIGTPFMKVQETKDA